VADPAGDRVDAIHVYRDLDGNGVLDPGSDGLLHADTTPADGYAFHAGSLPSGRHVLYVAAMKDGALAGSITTTLVAARWWSVSIGSRIHGEAGFETTGDLQADPTPIELAPGPGGGTWKDAVRSRVSGTLTTTNPGSQESHDYGFPEPGSDYTVPAPGSAFAIGTARELRAAFGQRHNIAVAADTRLIVLEDLVTFKSAVNDNDYDDQYFVVYASRGRHRGGHGCKRRDRAARRDRAGGARAHEDDRGGAGGDDGHAGVRSRCGKESKGLLAIGCRCARHRHALDDGRRRRAADLLDRGLRPEREHSRHRLHAHARRRYGQRQRWRTAERHDPGHGGGGGS
jgi:hypothetical protein